MLHCEGNDNPRPYYLDFHIYSAKRAMFTVLVVILTLIGIRRKKNG